MGGRGGHAAPRGGRGQRPGRARRAPASGPDPGLRPTRARSRPPRPQRCLRRRPRPSLPGAPGPCPAGTRPPQTWGKVSQLQAGPEARASRRRSFPACALGPHSGRRTNAAGPGAEPRAPWIWTGPLAPSRPGPPGPQGLEARYLRPQPVGASLPRGGSSSPGPTRPAARRRAVPGQRPCRPARPPARQLPSLLLASPRRPGPCAGRAGPTADPAVNPAPNRGSEVPSLPARGGSPHPWSLSAGHPGTPAPEDAPEAASGEDRSARIPRPSRFPEDPPGGHVGSPGPGCRRIQGGRGCALLPCGRRGRGRSVLLVRPPRVPAASQPAALSALSYLERPGPAGAVRLERHLAAARDLTGTAATFLGRTWGASWPAGPGLAHSGNAQIRPPRCVHRVLSAPAPISRFSRCSDLEASGPPSRRRTEWQWMAVESRLWKS